MKKILLIIIGIIVVIVIGLITLPWIIIAIGFASLPNPPMPEIRYGEFPFRLVYELNGEQIVVEDTIICEFDGIGSNAAVGKHRKWKAHLANSGGESVLLVSDDTRKIYCYVGDAEYYMDDETHPEERPLTPRIYSVKLNKSDMSILSQEEILDKYNIKLLSWDFTEPIVNSFN